MMADLGYLGITRTYPKAILSHWGGRGKQLSEDQKGENRRLPRDRTLVENFFGRCKSVFGICHGVYREEFKQLDRVIRLTIALTNWYLCRHPLRRPDEENTDESSEEEEIRNPPVCRLEDESSDSDGNQ
jgi:hypothetical protein